MTGIPQEYNRHDPVISGHRVLNGIVPAEGNLMTLFIKGKNVIASSGFSGNDAKTSKLVSWWFTPMGQLVSAPTVTDGGYWKHEREIDLDPKKLQKKTMCLDLNHHDTLANGWIQACFWGFVWWVAWFLNVCCWFMAAAELTDLLV